MAGCFQTQQVFRTLLQAMSNPGKAHGLSGLRPGGTSRASLLLLAETLLDQETSFCVIAGSGKEAREESVYELTKSRPAEIEKADFILAPEGTTGGRVLSAHRGAPEYPDRSATIIYGVASLAEEGNGGSRATLSGPGINGESVLHVHGLAPEELRWLAEANAAYPLGVDAVFLDRHNRIMCIPRSSRIEVT